LAPVYPNPVVKGQHTAVFFTPLNNGDATITVYDARGRAVLNVFTGIPDAGTTRYDIGTASLTPGMYSVVSSDGNTLQRQPLVVLPR